MYRTQYRHTQTIVRIQKMGAAAFGCRPLFLYTGYGLCMPVLWAVHGLWAAYVWPIYGICMSYIWPFCGHLYGHVFVRILPVFLYMASFVYLLVGRFLSMLRWQKTSNRRQTEQTWPLNRSIEKKIAAWPAPNFMISVSIYAPPHTEGELYPYRELSTLNVEESSCTI